MLLKSPEALIREGPGHRVLVNGFHRAGHHPAAANSRVVGAGAVERVAGRGGDIYTPADRNWAAGLSEEPVIQAVPVAPSAGPETPMMSAAVQNRPRRRSISGLSCMRRWPPRPS